MVDYSRSHLAETGDNLHFGLACHQARADGIEKVDILPVCDDVSLARSKGAVVGRRTLAATILGVTFYGLVPSFWRLFLFSSFQKLSALLQQPTSLVTLSLSSARPSPEPSFECSTIATFQDGPNTP